MNGHLEVIRVLVKEFGADAGAKTHLEGYTLLHIAAEYGHHEMMRAFVKEFGADVGAKDKQGRSPLHVAPHGCSTEAVSMLIKEGADLCAEDNNGWTPLHYAASSYNHHGVMCMLECGADGGAKNLNGQTPIQVAGRSGKVESIRVLMRELDLSHAEALRALVDVFGGGDNAALAAQRLLAHVAATAR